MHRDFTNPPAKIVTNDDIMRALTEYRNETSRDIELVASQVKVTATAVEELRKEVDYRFKSHSSKVERISKADIDQNNQLKEEVNAREVLAKKVDEQSEELKKQTAIAIKQTEMLKGLVRFASKPFLKSSAKAFGAA